MDGNHLIGILVLLWFPHSFALEEQCDHCQCEELNNPNVLVIKCSNKFPMKGSRYINPPKTETYLKYRSSNVWAELDGAGITAINKFYIYNLSNLSLTNNEISRIDAKIFENFGDLRHLSLKHNKIKVFASSSFHGLHNLLTLDLSYNLITRIQGNVFQPLASLQELRLNNNKLKELNDGGLFQYLSKLKILDISHNDITAIDDLMLKNQKQLIELKLSFNKLSKIPTYLFNSLNKLVVLDLSNNNIENLEREVFENLDSIKTLNLSHNNLASYQDVYLGDIKHLRTLDLSHNSLEIIDTSGFFNLKHLSSLNLSFNELREFNLQQNMSEMRILDLTHNYIRMLKIIDEKFPKLEELHLGWNNLEMFTPPKGIKFLNVSWNQLSSLDSTFHHFLSYLDISGNKFETVPESINGFFLPKLSHLWLDDNPIHFLKFNNLEGGNFEFFQFISAKRMENLYSLTDEALLPLINPKCSANIFEETGDTRYCNQGLVIEISHNKHLHTIEKGAFGYTVPKELDLSYNSLTRIDQQITKWEGVEYLNLQGNPWDCRCFLQWMLDLVLPRIYELNPENLYNFRCKSPPKLRDVRMVHFYNRTTPAFCDTYQRLLTIEDYQPKEQKVEKSIITTASLSAVAAILLVAIVGLIIVLVLQNRKKKRKLNRRNKHPYRTIASYVDADQVKPDYNFIYKQKNGKRTMNDAAYY